MSRRSVTLVFAPDRLQDCPIPDDGSLVAVVRFARRKEEVADCAAILRDQERDFTIVWIDNAGHGLDPGNLSIAEKDQALSLARSLSRGRAERAILYREDVERIVVSQAEVETVCEC